MLTPEYLLHAVEPAEEIAEQLHTDIINRIIDRILIRFQRGDSYILTPLDKWQIETLQQAGYLLEDIEKTIAAATGKMQSEIAEAMEDAGVRTLQYDDAIYRAAGLNPVPIQKSPYMIRLMQRNYEATLGEWRNFTHISKQAVHKLFVQSCDTAYHQAVSGAISPSQAVLEALETIIEGGAYVEYPGGRRDTIETATARAVRTGISQASGDITDARMEEMDWDIILVSSHLGARVTEAEDYTNHYWWQGQFYSKSGNDKRFPPYAVCGFGKIQGIHGANCRHSHGPGDGIHNPFEHYDSEENRKMYELEQRQRELERRIRKTKRETMNWKKAADAETDPVMKEKNQEKYQQKAALLQKQNEAYNKFCEETGLKKQHDRIRIAKWDRKQAAMARAAARKYNASQENREKNLNFIQQDATIKAGSGLPKKREWLPDEKLKHTVKVDVLPTKPGDFEFHAVTPKDADLKKVEVMAGYGTSSPIRDLRRLYETYNLEAEYWEKKSGTAYGQDYHYVIHWYENKGFVPVDEIKLKGMKKNK